MLSGPNDRFPHELPPGIELTKVLKLNQGTKESDLIAPFKVNSNTFGVCTEQGTVNIWNNTFLPTTTMDLNIPCYVVAFYSVQSEAGPISYLVVSTEFPPDPAKPGIRIFGLYFTNGTDTPRLPVHF